MKNKHIKNLTTAGVGVFLVTGLSGCDGDNDCIKNAQYSPNPQKSLEECKKTGSSSYHSSSYVPVSSTKSGYFSSSESTHSTLGS